MLQNSHSDDILYKLITYHYLQNEHLRKYFVGSMGAQAEVPTHLGGG